ncbi:MAG: AAA family ATPase [Rhodospirillaceae bacterium]|nr:AAA family ATPase [Rhodospirillaceae bacterium]
MPYLAHFGLREHPFTLTPNTNQYYPVDKHVEIIQSIQFGIARNTGILKVVGDVGTGKTMLCRLLLRKLVTDNDAVAYLNAPQVDPDSIVGLVCAEFGLENGTKAQMLQALNAFLLEQHALGRNAVLIVDEAQALGAAGLEAVRLLSNLETERSKLLQIVMFGQSELDDLLAQPNLRQINQRIGFSFNTGPLSLDEAVHYMTHRVKCSRVEGVDFPVFNDAAMAAIARAAAFVPRVINILADKALLVAYGDGAIQVGENHAEAAIDDSPQIAKKITMQRGWVRRALLGLIVLEAVAVIALFTFSPALQSWAKGTWGRVTGRAPATAPLTPASVTPVSVPPATVTAAPQAVPPPAKTP